MVISFEIKPRFEFLGESWKHIVTLHHVCHDVISSGSRIPLSMAGGFKPLKLQRGRASSNRNKSQNGQSKRCSELNCAPAPGAGACFSKNGSP